MTTRVIFSIYLISFYSLLFFFCFILFSIQCAFVALIIFHFHDASLSFFCIYSCTRKQKSQIASANLLFLCSTTIFFVNIVRRNVRERKKKQTNKKKKKHSWVRCLEGVVRVSVNTLFLAYVYSQSSILSSINFPWNLSKTFGSVDFIVVRILSLLPARENICSQQRILKYYFDMTNS